MSDTFERLIRSTSKDHPVCRSLVKWSSPNDEPLWSKIGQRIVKLAIVVAGRKIIRDSADEGVRDESGRYDKSGPTYTSPL